MKAMTCTAIIATLIMATPALAKTKAKGGKITGVHCSQGPDNGYFPASSLKPSLRAKLYKGQKIKFNYPGYGPIACVVY